MNPYDDTMTRPELDAERRDGTPVMLRGDEDFSDSVRALLFGVLADLAAPVVKHYRSDLFHDAHWISEHVTGPTAFYFAVRKYGTHIGTDADSMHYAQRLAGSGSRLYTVTLAHEATRPGAKPWKWTVAVTDVTP